MAKAGLHLEVACASCGVIYRQSRSDQLYCSGACASRGWRASKRVEPSDTKCAQCGNSFEPRASRHKFCSKDCNRAADLARSKKQHEGGVGKGWSKGAVYAERQVCQQCGESFYAPPVQMRRGGGKFCSKKCYVDYAAIRPETFPRSRGPRGKGGRRDDLDNRYFRSSWEANWARYLNWLIKVGEIIKWEYEVDTFEFIKIKRGGRFYTPDFKIENRDGTIEYHEVKGYMDQRSQTKLNRMAQYYPQVKLILVDKESYKAVAKQFKRSLPGWE